MQQKVIWFILFLIISGLTFYWVVIRDSELSRYDDNREKFEGLTEDVTETTEIHDDFKTMWIGRGKHIETIQANIKSFKNEYNKKMKKIDEEFDEVENSIDKAEKDFRGLVISNEGAHFSAGANVGMIFMMAVEQEWDEMDFAVRAFQNTTMRLRY